MSPNADRGRSLALARAAEAWSALVCLYLALSLPIQAQYAPLLVHWYGSGLVAGILAWRLGRPSQGTLGAATLFALYTFVRILMVLPRVAEIGAAYASAARNLSLVIFSSVAVAQLVVLLSLWRGGWFRRESWSFLLLAWLVLASCTTEPGCDICTTSAVVYGRVTTSSGSAVVGARIRVEAFRDTCGAGFAMGRTNVEPFTAADGSYRDQPYALMAPFHACLRVTVTPTAASGLTPRTVEGAQVQFLDDYRPRGRDSVRVDVTLQP